ncbi:hypothetical protein LOK49_LG10G00434 [Camellia lanceoleosa]|uniref:Uncharacterized protein n=1 Tax=Camellia lanceoleosa TaxID=1840588 RepID=A0ACC0GBX2_9ERIC|nr:hypothetical protein LOK49_LG10G00434 [Camellia lanceoleosa]
MEKINSCEKRNPFSLEDGQDSKDPKQSTADMTVFFSSQGPQELHPFGQDIKRSLFVRKIERSNWVTLACRITGDLVTASSLFNELCTSSFRSLDILD